jgi:hypothetical protein
MGRPSGDPAGCLIAAHSGTPSAVALEVEHRRADLKRAISAPGESQVMWRSGPVGPSERRLVGLNVFVVVLAGCIILGTFTFAWGFLSRLPNGPAESANVLPACCGVSILMILLGQARIVVDGAGFIDMIGPLVVRRVPVADVVAIETDAGVAVRLVSGRRIGTVAYQRGRTSRPGSLDEEGLMRAARGRS